MKETYPSKPYLMAVLSGAAYKEPKQVQMNEVKIYVVSPSENFDEFKKEFEAKNGADSYIAISVKDYENLAKNFAELRRYIEQQKQIILYYEEAVKPQQKEEDEGNISK